MKRQTERQKRRLVAGRELDSENLKQTNRGGWYMKNQPEVCSLKRWRW